MAIGLFHGFLIIILMCTDVFSEQSQCYSISKAIHQASAVFTGRIDALLFSNEVALITVKRVVKKNASPELNSLMVGHQIRVHIANELNDSTEGDIFCDESRFGHGSNTMMMIKRKKNVIRVRDTKVLFVRLRDGRKSVLVKNRQDERNTFLELDSGPLPISLEILDRINAAIKDMTFKPRVPIVEEQCEKAFCHFGADCVPDSEGRARCQCPEECPNVFTPICGTDGITYENNCVLRRKACLGEINARMEHSGLCGAPGTADRRRN